eukprot:14380560-Alexandrium_andersonii.AAC.1
MSASLVGSEMCIRDRPAHCLNSKRVSVLQPTCVWEAMDNWITQTHVRSCLLYTSDAADDM